MDSEFQEYLENYCSIVLDSCIYENDENFIDSNKCSKCPFNEEIN